jgi:pSer/pThr/pTyr-binding forkhead associated (FHA) protein
VSKKGPTVTAAPEGGLVRPDSVRGVYNTTTFETILFGDKPLLAVGRRDSGYPVDVALDDDRVSRLHCVIRPADGGYVVVTDLSKNGTVLGRARIHQSTADLLPGDVLRVGATELVLVTHEGPQFGTDVQRFARAALAYHGNSMRAAARALGFSAAKLKRLLG